MTLTLESFESEMTLILDFEHVDVDAMRVACT